MRLSPIHIAVLTLATVSAAQTAPADINPAAKFIAMAATLPPYDVASIRQNNSNKRDSSLDTTYDGVAIENASFAEIVEYAYNIASFDLISGIDGHLGSARFDISAKIADRDSNATKLTDEQLRAMLIPLLADRFHLRVHLMTKKLTVFELVVAAGGPKFKLAGTDNSSLSANWGRQVTLDFKRSSMSTLAGVLSDSGLHSLVVDRTGLAGAADFSLKWSSEATQVEGGPNVVSIFTAIQEELGLKLKPVKLPVDILVIDHVEMPSGN